MVNPFDILNIAIAVTPNAVELIRWTIKRFRPSQDALRNMVMSPVDGETPATAEDRSTPAGPLPDSWLRYSGARPEVTGAPANTILAMPGIEKMSPAFRSGLIALADSIGMPVDTFAVIIYNESRFNPKAAYMKDGRPFAAGLIQLTTAARVPGFMTRDDLARVLEMSPEEQLESIVSVYWKRWGARVRGITPGVAYMLNFLPAFASKPASFVLGEKDNHNILSGDLTFNSVWSMNPGLREGGTGGSRITVGSVDNVVVQNAKLAKNKRITVDGRIIDGPPITGGGSLSTTSSASAAGSTPAAGPADGTLRKGSKDPKGTKGPVTAWQEKLLSLGYTTGTVFGVTKKLSADGDFGSITESATKAFQKDQGFADKDQNGVVDDRTRAAADVAKPKAGAAPTPPPPAKSTESSPATSATSNYANSMNTQPPAGEFGSASPPAGGTVADRYGLFLPETREPGSKDRKVSSAALLREASEAGEIDPIAFAPVKWNGLIVYVATDALKTSGFRLPASYEDFVALFPKAGWVPMNQGIADAAYKQAQKKIVASAQTGTAEDLNVMGKLALSKRLHKDVENKLEKAGGLKLGELTMGGWKHWIMHPRIKEKGAVNYGFWRANGSPIQTVGGQHDAAHTDYSQLAQPVQRFAEREGTGEKVDLLDEYAKEGIPEKYLAPFRTEIA